MKIRFFMLLVALFALTLTAAAQTSRGTVSGTISDPTGAVIPGANVTLTNNETGLTRTTVTNGEGFYRFDAVDLGTYSVNITAANFAALTKTNIVVQANQTADVPATLQPGGAQTTIEVTADAGALLQTEAPVRGGNIEEKRITELPFATRNPVALALTLPGVSSNRGGAGSSTFSVNGARGRSNNFLIDGTENNDISIAGQGFQITNPDAVQEVSVQTSNYDAEFGRAGGAVVNTITKSGTNNFHGTLSSLLDSTRDDAITTQQGRDPAVLRRGHPPFGIENIYSGTLGGPLYLPRFGEGGRATYSGKNRTFFFGAYQEDRQRSASNVALFSLTAAGRARLRSLFPAGASPNADLYLNSTANAIAVADPFPLDIGSRPGCPAPCNIEAGTFFRSVAAPYIDRQYQIRIDHKLSENDQLSARFLSDRNAQPLATFTDALTFEGFDADTINRYYNFLVTETHVFSPTLTNETRLAYNRIQLGFPLSDSNGLANTQPRIEINSSGLTGLGAETVFPQGRTANNYVIQDTVTKIAGDHTFRGGIDFLRQIATQIAPSIPRGSITYTSGGGFSSFANFLDNVGGSSGSATRDIGSPKYFPQLFRTAAFFQDRWKATDALTLTLGVRYEYFGVPFNSLRTPAFSGLFNVDPVTRTGPFSQPNKIPPDRNNFAPTFGIAYSPSFRNGLFGRVFGERKSVLRAGYQIGYDSFYNNLASNAQSSSPNLIRTTINSTLNAANPRGTPAFSGQLPTTAAALNPLSAQTLLAPNLVNPYYQRFSVGFQRELPSNIIMDVAYVGSKGTKLFITEDLNPLVRPELRITPAGYTGPTSGRLDNLQGQRNIRTNGGSSTYHSAQFEVRRRFANNFTLTAAYTFSKLIDNFSDPFAQTGTTSGAVFQVPAILGGERLDRAVSLFDRPHRASFTYVYELPFMREQRGALGHLLGGFQLSGVTIFESGYPYTVFNGLDADGLGGGFDRPNYNPNGQRGVRAKPVVNAQGFIIGYVNPDAGNAPIDPNTAQFIGNPAYVAGLAGSVPRTGTLGRNTQRTPGINNFNVNILKRTRLGENKSLEFRTEFYNIFNHPQFLQGSVSQFSPTGGTINSNLDSAPAGRFLNPDTPTSDSGGRVIRYQLKFIF